MIFLWRDDEGEGAGAADPRLGWLLSQIGRQMSLLARKKHWQSLLPSSPTRVMHQNQFCISSPVAKTSPAFNPSSVSPSSRDANTQMICTHHAVHCNRMLGLEPHPNDMRERSGLVGCTYYYSTQLEILVGTAQQKCKSSTIYSTYFTLWNNWSTSKSWHRIYLQ